MRVVSSIVGRMNAAEFAELGAALIEKGNKLNELKEARDKLNQEIEALETELRPLVAQHAKFVAELVGQPTITPVPGTKPTSVPGPGAEPKLSDDLKAKIKKYADTRADPETGISAQEIADALKIDPLLVRLALNDMARRGA